MGRNMKKLEEVEKRSIAEDYINGATLHECAKKYRRGYDTINKIVNGGEGQQALVAHKMKRRLPPRRISSRKEAQKLQYIRMFLDTLRDIMKD